MRSARDRTPTESRFSGFIGLLVRRGCAVAPWITASKVEQEIAVLEAAAQQDERISPIVVYSTIRRLEAEAFALEKTLNATGLITF